MKTSLIKQRPASGTLSVFRNELDDLFENFFGTPFTWPQVTEDNLPRLDLSETDDALEVVTDVPGFKPNEIDIEVGDGFLTVSGKHAEESEQKPEGGRQFHRIERRSGSFTRSVRLPAVVDESKIDAEVHDGVLNIRLPKAPEAKRRKIAVKGAEQHAKA
jgi:HSP20 family protein